MSHIILIITMSASPFITEASLENFTEVVIQQSHECPVLVDFWADWCSPCKMLMPLLGKLVQDYNGAFRLVKVNSDQQQELAAQFGVRSLPTVKLFKDGKPIDEFMGALPENQIRTFLDKHMVNETDQHAVAAINLLQNGEIDAANKEFSAVFSASPQHVNSLLALASYTLGDKQYDLCQQYLDKLPVTEQGNPEVVKLKAQLDISRASGDTDIDTLIQDVDSDPNNLSARLVLGNAYIAQQEIEKGLQQFLSIIQADRNFQDDAGRSAMLNTFNMLGSGDPLVRAYRGKLARVLN